MKRQIYKFVDYTHMLGSTGIWMYGGIAAASFLFFIFQSDYRILLITSVFVILFVVEWLFCRRVYIINFENSKINFPGLITDISSIEAINVTSEESTIYLSNNLHEGRLSSYSSSPLERSMEDYEEYPITHYILKMSGKFGDKEFSFGDRENRDKIYEILQNTNPKIN